MTSTITVTNGIGVQAGRVAAYDQASVFSITGISAAFNTLAVTGLLTTADGATALAPAATGTVTAGAVSLTFNTHTDAMAALMPSGRASEGAARLTVFVTSTAADCCVAPILITPAAAADAAVVESTETAIGLATAQALVDAHTSDTTAAHAASAISAAATPTNYTAATADVEAHLAGVDTALATLATAMIQGALGATDNAIPRVDGTGGVTLQGSDLVIEDATTSTQANITVKNTHSETNSGIVLTPKGSGPFVLGQKPDGNVAGGNARGSNGVDLQQSRTQAAAVASGNSSGLLAGTDNRSTGPMSGCLAGYANSASGEYAACLAGYANVAAALNSIALGRYAVTWIAGQLAQASGRLVNAGDAQTSLFSWRGVTTSTSATELFVYDAVRVTIPKNKTIYLDLQIVARRGNGRSGYARRCCCVERTGNTTRLVSPVETIGTDVWDTELGTPSITIAADDALEAVTVFVAAGNTTETAWIVGARATEVGKA